MDFNRRFAGYVMVVCAAGVGFSAPALADNKVAHFELTGALLEKPAGDAGLGFGPQPVTLADLVQRILDAGRDDDVRALLFSLRNPAFGLAQIDELRVALGKVDKPIYFHADSLMTGSYALASAGSHISVTPTGDVWLLGMYAESPYLKGLLDKIHVKADYVHIGDWKSAGEMFTETGPSGPAADNMNWLLDGIFSSMVGTLADARFGGNLERAGAILEEGTYTAEAALDAGLIDSVQHVQDLTAQLKEQFGEDLIFVSNYGASSGPSLDFGNPFGIFKLLAELRKGKQQSTEPAIAVIHVVGTILTGKAESNPFGASSGAYSTNIRLALDKAANDDSVKAVVLRVDSPGGSALASEIIYDAVARVRAAGKPVIASMGNVAASGGYYVSCGTDRILAGPNTITASIGVVGGKMVTTGMWDSVGVTWHAYKRGGAAELMSSARAWNDPERKKIHDWMLGVYDIFKGHITEHRSDQLAKPIDEMAGGRVFSGRQALDLGLVDQLGTMSDAVRVAAEMARIDDFELRVLPKPPTLFDLFDKASGERERSRISLSSSIASSFLGQRASFIEGLAPILAALDPQRVGVLEQAIQRLDILHREHVVLMPPVASIGFEGR
ncbi:MAG: protease-4 [Chlamydiales bacterium]|jgi:protease-4